MNIRPIRVLLVDDEAPVRRGLRMLLDLEDDLQIVGEAADGDSALAAARALRPDVVLMDVEMPGVNGISATGQLSRTEPCAVVILSIHDDGVTRNRAKKAGARAFVAKQEITSLPGVIRLASQEINRSR